MFKNIKCIPCQGGIPPLNNEEIEKFYPLINSSWIVEETIKLIRNFKFDDYLAAIKFTNLVADLARPNERNYKDFSKWDLPKPKGI